MFLHLSVILFTRRGVSVRGVSVRWISVQEGLCPRGPLSRGISVWRVAVWGVSVQRGVSVRENPHTVKSGWYTSYWSAFLLQLGFFSLCPFLLPFCINFYELISDKNIVFLKYFYLIY